MPLTQPSSKQSRIIWVALTGLAVAVIVALVVLAVWSLGKVLNLLSPVLWPLAIAAVIACLLSPLVDFFEHKRMRRGRATVLVFAMVLAVIGGVFAIVVPKVVTETQDLTAQIPQYADRLQTQVTEFMAEPTEYLRRLFHKSEGPAPGPAPAAKQAAMNRATDWIKENLPKISSWLLQHLMKVFSGLGLMAGLILVPIYAFYFLLEKRTIQSRWRDYLPLKESHARDELAFVLDSISGYLIAFFRGQVLVAISDGILYTVGFLIIGVNYAFLFGLLAMVLTMIPFVGAIGICAAALTLAVVQFSDWTHPLLVFALFAVVQSLESMYISPKIMGDRVGLHPLVIIVAVMVGMTLLGSVLGGILAIPLAAVLRVVLFRYVWTEHRVAQTQTQTAQA